jgi:hypothetical protein
LPAGLCHLSHLKQLYLSDNQLTELPIECYKLYQIEKLTLFENPLPLEMELFKLVDKPNIVINDLTERKLKQEMRKEQWYRLLVDMAWWLLMIGFMVMLLAELID